MPLCMSRLLKQDSRPVRETQELTEDIYLITIVAPSNVNS